MFLNDTKEVEQVRSSKILMGSTRLEKVHRVAGETRRNSGRRNSKTETGNHLFLEPTLEEDGVVDTAPFLAIQRPTERG
jgi:hypothetical protein